MQKRTLKASTKTGKVERAKIRSTIRALHVMSETGEGWAVRKMGYGRLTEHFASKQDALKFARNIGKRQKTNLIIHERDGRIINQRQSGRDSVPQRGRAQ